MKYWIFLISVFYFGCDAPSSDTSKKTSAKVHVDSIVYFDSITGVSEKEIYDFMNVFVADQKLSRGQDLYDKAINCSMDLSDTSMFIVENFRKKQVEDSIKTAKTNSDSKWNFSTVYFVDGGALGSISKEDAGFMHKQTARANFFRWKRSAINFSQTPSDTNNFYEFSLPLFNKKRDLVLITLESLCPGLCGTGTNLIYRKEGGKWKGSQVGWWVH